MSVYFVKGKGWRYDFTMSGTRQTAAWFKTKTEAKEAEAEKRKELKNPPVAPETPTDMAFLDLVNARLDYVEASNSKSHYRDMVYHARRWLAEWNETMVSQISHTMIEQYVIKRSKVSSCVANKELQYLRALFNYGLKRKIITHNPTEGLGFLPVHKKKKYVPSKEDAVKVISVADPDTQDYLWTILLSGARVGEVNALTWSDVDFDERVLTLWTRKRKNGNLESRDVPMVEKLYQILRYRFSQRDPDKPWVFWHTSWSVKAGGLVSGPYLDRKKIMKSLCSKARVQYFRFHALRHLAASMLDSLGVPIGVIQRILGHQNRRTTELYLHSIGEAERQAMTKLGRIIPEDGDNKQKPSHPTNVPKEFWQRKVPRPSLLQLSREVAKDGFSSVGRKYGVSDNAVRKWLKSSRT